LLQFDNHFAICRAFAAYRSILKAIVLVSQLATSASNGSMAIPSDYESRYSLS